MRHERSLCSATASDFRARVHDVRLTRTFSARRLQWRVFLNNTDICFLLDISPSPITIKPSSTMSSNGSYQISANHTTFASVDPAEQLDGENTGNEHDEGERNEDEVMQRDGFLTAMIQPNTSSRNTNTMGPRPISRSHPDTAFNTQSGPAADLSEAQYRQMVFEEMRKFCQAPNKQQPSKTDYYSAAGYAAYRARNPANILQSGPSTMQNRQNTSVQPMASNTMPQPSTSASGLVPELTPEQILWGNGWGFGARQIGPSSDGDVSKNAWQNQG